jgi:DNA helicase-2/ATP-dependent DNA helicase PcrA
MASDEIHRDIRCSYLDDLNAAQREAVLTTEGPLLVVAGAGAGKTKMLTYRIFHLTAGEGVRPENILALTFTNKAAGEMRERVVDLMSTNGFGVLHAPGDAPLGRFQLRTSNFQLPFLGTFHSLGASILREYGTRLGVPRHFKILDRSDSTRLVREALRDEGLDPKLWDPARILNAISRKKGDAISREAFADAASSFPERVTADVWERYERSLARERSLDFDDLLLRSLDLLRREQDVLAHYRTRFHYIHIDEYQDTNRVQYELARLLAEERRNICVVGDSDQSIYSWRGADLRNLLDFERDYPDSRVVLLEENYRSTKTILAAANDVIKKNVLRKDKTLYTKNAEGERIGISSCYDEQHEARFVASEAQALIARGTLPEEIAVLYRTNAQSRVLEEAFLDALVPYQVVGTRFFERKEVKDVLAYLRVVLTIAESEPRSLADRGSSSDVPQFLRDPALAGDLARIIGVPPRGIGKATVLKLIGDKPVPPSAIRRLGVFADELHELALVARNEKPSETLRRIIEETGIATHLADGTEEGEEREANVRELVSLALKYESLEPLEGIERLLEDATLASDQDALDGAKSAVRLMTVHAAKGLEFDHVFIAGLEQGLFPHERDGDATDAEREEERRLFYVALTRARKRVHLTCVSIRTVFGSRNVALPSEFLADISDHLLEAVEPGAIGKERVITF